MVVAGENYGGVFRIRIAVSKISGLCSLSQMRISLPFLIAKFSFNEFSYRSATV